MSMFFVCYPFKYHDLVSSVLMCVVLIVRYHGVITLVDCFGCVWYLGRYVGERVSILCP